MQRCVEYKQAGDRSWIEKVERKVRNELVWMVFTYSKSTDP